MKHIFRSLYDNSASCVRIGIEDTVFFNVYSGVRQGCVLSPFLFLIAVDYIMKKTANGGNFGIQLGESNLSDLDFADDIALIGKDQA